MLWGRVPRRYGLVRKVRLEDVCRIGFDDDDDDDDNDSDDR